MKKLMVSMLCVVAWASFSSVQAEEKLKIGWVLAMANAPIVIAKEKGFFKDQGLEVDIIQFAEGPTVQQAMATGQVDMAYIGAPPIYHWYAQGLKSKILAKVNYGQAAVIVNKTSGINSVKDLKGKKIAGVKKGSGMDVLLRGFVLGEHAELKPDVDVSIISMPTGNMADSLEGKMVDAAFTWEPFTTQSLVRGNTKLILDTNKAIPNHLWYVVMALPQTLEKKRSAVVKALQAHKKAVEFLNSSPTAGNDIIIKTFSIEEITGADGKKVTPAQIVGMARERLGWAWNFTDSDKKFIQRMMNYSFNLGFLETQLKAEDLLDMSLLADMK